MWAFAIVLVCGCAWTFGGRTERIGASIIFASWIATMLVANSHWWEPRWNIWIVDSLLLVGLLGLALRSSRHWPIFAAGFHLLSIVTHATRLVSTYRESWALVTAGVIWSYMVLFTLGLATWLTWRRARDAQSDDQAAGRRNR